MTHYSFYVFHLMLCIAALGLQGCTSYDATQPGLSYVAMPKTPVAVSGVSVEISPCVRENNPLVTVPLSTMVKQWSCDHWNAAGGAHHMVFYIQKIDMKEEVLACAFSPKKWVSIPNSDIYKGHMVISCQLRAPNGQVVAKTDFTIRHEQHVPENYTIAQRKVLWHQVCEGMINQLTLETNTHIPGMPRRATGV